MKKTMLWLLTVTTLATSGAQAGPVTIDFIAVIDRGFIGLDGLGAAVETRETHVHCPGIISPCWEQEVGVPYTITSGPLIDVHVQEPPFGLKRTVYTFEEGLLQIDFTWTNSEGLQETGGFTAPVFNLVDASGRFLRSIVMECDSCPDRRHTQDDFRVGVGLFDENVARWLGVERETQGGDFNFYLEQILGDETSARRTGNLNQPGLGLYATAVPEPATGVLLLGGLAGLLIRRRHGGR